MKNFITFLVIFLATSGAQSDVIKVSAIENSAFSHFAQDVMKEAYSRLGHTLDVKFYPAQRALVESSSGRVDGELFRIAGLEKRFPTLIPVKVPIFNSKWQAYSKKPLQINGWNSLKEFQLGTRRGIATTDAGTSGMNVRLADSNANLFKMLQADRVEVIILSKVNADKVLNQTPYPAIKELSPPVQTIPVFHYIHENHQNYIPDLERVLADMVDDGSLEQITEKNWPLLTQ